MCFSLQILRNIILTHLFQFFMYIFLFSYVMCLETSQMFFVGMCPTFKLQGVFNQRDSPSSSEGQPRTTAVAYKVLGVSWTSLTNDSKEDSSRLVFWLLLVCLWLLWERCQLRWENVTKLYMNIPT